MKLDTLSPEFKHSSRRGVDKGVNQAVSGGVDRGGNLGAQRSPKTSPATDAPSHDPNLPDNQAKTHWIEIVLVGEDGKPIPGEAYRITFPTAPPSPIERWTTKERLALTTLMPATAK